MKVDILTKGCYILNPLLSVVVDLICFCSAAWADMHPPGKFNLYVLFLLLIPNFFYNYIFQS